MFSFLRYVVVAAFCFSLLSLIVLVLKTFIWGRKTLHSEPRGKAFRGILYAFGRGMMPWEKESAAKNLPTYVAGVLYHSGIFAGLVYVFLCVAALDLSPLSISILRIIIVGGFASGTGLLLKRILKPTLREISFPDDFASNILVDLFLAAAFIDSLYPSIKTVLYVVSIVLFLYMPVGKIRHCFFFFYSRVLFGMFFGRRGVFPQDQGTLNT
jgi:hypothetical protein